MYTKCPSCFKRTICRNRKTQNTLFLHDVIHFCCPRRSQPKATDTQQAIEADQVGDQPDTSVSG